MAKSKTKKTKKENTGAPQIVAAKGGLTSAQLVRETLILMEDKTRISKAAGKDFMDSMVAVIEETLGEGKPVNIGGVVKLTPRLHTKGQREVNEIFGDPESKKITKKYPAKVTIKATVMKRAKDAVATVQKMQKSVGR